MNHPLSPSVLYDRIERIFNYSRGQPTGERVGGHDKLAAIKLCQLDDSHQVFAPFPKSGLNILLDDLGRVLAPRYRSGSSPEFHLETSPYLQHFIGLLRTASERMEPLCVTPRGLQSPTNDSIPPQDYNLWANAKVENSNEDYCLKIMAPYTEKSKAVQQRKKSKLTSRQFHGMDGSYVSHRSKRSHPEDQMEVSSKRQRR